MRQQQNDGGDRKENVTDDTSAKQRVVSGVSTHCNNVLLAMGCTADVRSHSKHIRSNLGMTKLYSDHSRLNSLLSAECITGAYAHSRIQTC